MAVMVLAVDQTSPVQPGFVQTVTAAELQPSVAQSAVAVVVASLAAAQLAVVAEAEQFVIVVGRHWDPMEMELAVSGPGVDLELVEAPGKLSIYSLVDLLAEEQIEPE